MLRATVARNARLFTTSARSYKSPVESVKETAKKVDRTISDAAVKGIEKGEQAASTIKSTVGAGSKKAEGTASKVSGEASGKASELTGEAKGKANELAGQAKGKAEEVKGKM